MGEDSGAVTQVLWGAHGVALRRWWGVEETELSVVVTATAVPAIIALAAPQEATDSAALPTLTTPMRVPAASGPLLCLPGSQ